MTMIRPARIAALAAGLALLASGTSSGGVVDLSASKDNTLYEYEVANGDRSNGAGSYMFSGHTDQQKKRRALLAFDIAGAIPAGSTINSVTLTLNVSRDRDRATRDMSLRRVLADWGEGASNADSQEGQGTPATTGDATWRHRYYDTALWSTAGGQFASSASATTAVGGTGFYMWGSTSQMVADVQSWLDAPSGNFGWILIGFESDSQTARRFDSRENGTIANRPRLTVNFTPPSPMGACCTSSGTCSFHAPTDCAAQGDAYLGDGTTCSPNPCLQPTGACCESGGACSVRTQAECATVAGSYRGDGSDCFTADCPVALTPFVDPLPLPAVAQPVSGVPGGPATYEMRLSEVQQRLHRDLPLTTVWGYAGSYPGPTIEASQGQPVTVTWINDLRDALGNLRTQHFLPVDLCLHGPDMAGSTPRVVTHLHGGHVPAESDGHPEATLLPGQQDTYVYPNDQLPATLWYHDHALGITRLNVIMGLAGFYLLRDPFEQSLDLPAGQYEIPLAIQDRMFNADGSFRYPAAWQEHFFGDTILVNGKVWPYLTVRQGKYRFRVLNGSTSRTYTLSLSPPGAPMYQVGTEGGLLPAPVAIGQITLAPGERADLVIDFEGQSAGTEIVLSNNAPVMFPGTPGDGVVPNVMKFIVTSQSGHTAPLPLALRPLEQLSEAAAARRRTFELRKSSDPCTGSIWLINGLRFHDITEYPRLDSVEVWSFINRSGVMHPMHMHLVMFQVLDRQAFELVDGQVVPVGPRTPPALGEAGWKDTVQTMPGEITRVIARFDAYKGQYPYHCHILEHEDQEMMRQFRTVRCGDLDLEPGEQCDDGNLAPGDACSADCRWENFLHLAGLAQGGSVQLVVEGIATTLATSAGQTPAQVAAALAAAINADPALRALGISAFTDGDEVIVNGAIASATLGDAGLIGRLELKVGPGLLWWSYAPQATGYDVVSGDLATLSASRGDFTVATQACAANDLAGTTLSHPASPAAGAGWWFLVRQVTATGPGTFDEGVTSQVGLRDQEIEASGGACP